MLKLAASTTPSICFENSLRCDALSPLRFAPGVLRNVRCTWFSFFVVPQQGMVTALHLCINWVTPFP
jgi:hypothetical protein